MLVFRHLMGVSASLVLIIACSIATKAQEPLGQLISPPSTSSPSKTTTPEAVNPNSNPLNFPTKPEEVKTQLTPITLAQAIETAIRNNKQLQGARISLERSQAELDQALAAQLPSLDFSTSFQYADDAQTELNNAQAYQRFEQGFYQERTLESFQNDILSPEVNAIIIPRIELTYDLYTGGRTSANITKSEKQLRRDQLEVEVTLEDTRFNASRDYYSLQSADAQVAIEQARVEDATQTLRDAQLLEQAGLGTRYDVLQAEVQLANANQSLTRAISDQRSARSQLAQTLSIAENIQLTAADEIKEVGAWSLPLEDTIVLAYKNRAELEQQLLDREISQQDRNVALADRLPQVTLFANYDLYDNFSDGFGATDGYAFGARLRWNLFDGGSAEARARQADANIALAETRFADQRNQIRLQVEQAYYDLIANKENIATAQKSIETARESLRLARLRFQAGVGTQTDVINSQTELTTSRGNFLTAIIGYNQALNTLQRAVSNYPNTELFKKP